MKEQTIYLYGKQYKEITYDDGSIVLKRYSQQYNTWITLQFSQTEELDKIKKITFDCLRK